MSILRDRDLVAAIERAYRDDYPRYLRLAVAILADADRGRDAVQEAFVRALRSRRDLHGLKNLDGWLWRTLVNVCLVEKRRPAGSDRHPLEPVTNGRVEDWWEVRAMIAALPERQRLVLFLRHYADLDYQHIAEALQIERGTVAATLHRTHEKIRKAMTEVTR